MFEYITSNSIGNLLNSGDMCNPLHIVQSESS